MLDLLFKFIFKIITTVADIIVSPLINGVLALFPSLSYGWARILEFVHLIFNIIPVIVDNMLIPRAYFIALLDYFVIKYSIYLVRRAINFTINIYNYFKP